MNDFKGTAGPMTVTVSDKTDYDAWLALAREVESLFGPMADEPGFQEALKGAIAEDTAYCIRSDHHENKAPLAGGIVISRATNEIAWLAVAEPHRGKGLGRQLLVFALDRLNPYLDMVVQTFDASVPQGAAARKLYLDFGFKDDQDGGLNPAGVRTMIMRRPAQEPAKEKQ